MRNEVPIYPNRIRELRDAMGIKQNFIAKSVGMAQSYFTQIETGRRPLSSISAGKLLILSKILGVSPEDLFVEAA